METAFFATTPLQVLWEGRMGALPFEKQKEQILGSACSFAHICTFLSDFSLDASLVPRRDASITRPEGEANRSVRGCT